jgi:hypothetical protein
MLEETLARLLMVGGMLGMPALLYVGIRWANMAFRRAQVAEVEADPALAARVAELEQQLVELQERMDFTERVLAARREAGQLHG